MCCSVRPRATAATVVPRSAVLGRCPVGGTVPRADACTMNRTVGSRVRSFFDLRFPAVHPYK